MRKMHFIRIKRNHCIAALTGTLLAALASRLPAQAVEFEHRLIDRAPPTNPWIKAAGDFDGDGRIDLAVGGSRGPLVWYRNPDWSRGLVAEGGYESVDGEAGDVDGDGDLDLVIGGVLWYENPAPARAPADGPWTAHRIGRHRTHDVELADLDRDGKLDVAVRGQTGFGHNEGHRVLLWRQRSPDDWDSREVACPQGEGLRLADLDADGDADLLVGTRWYENDGRLIDGAWREHVLTTAWTHGDCKVDVGDFNGDGRSDVVLTPAEYKDGSYRIAWFAAPADRREREWAEHVVAQPVESVVHALAAADMNGDGRADIVTASMHQGRPPQEVCVFLNDGRGIDWTKVVASARGSHNIVLADIDGDGRPDILGANHGGGWQPVERWLNRGPMTNGSR